MAGLNNRSFKLGGKRCYSISPTPKYKVLLLAHVLRPSAPLRRASPVCRHTIWGSQLLCVPQSVVDPRIHGGHCPRDPTSALLHQKVPKSQDCPLLSGLVLTRKVHGVFTLGGEAEVVLLTATGPSILLWHRRLWRCQLVLGRPGREACALGCLRSDLVWMWDLLICVAPCLTSAGVMPARTGRWFKDKMCPLLVLTRSVWCRPRPSL